MPFCGPQPSVAVPFSAIKVAIQGRTAKCHTEEWKKRPDCVQTKQFIQEPYGGTGINCCNMSRKALRDLTQVITGHSVLQGHLRTLGLVEDSTCTMCGVEAETSNHFLGICEKYCALRFEILGAHTLLPEELAITPLTSLSQFIDRTGRFLRNQEGSVSAQ